MRKKKFIIILVSVFVFLTLIGGSSYAYFVYNKDIADVSLETGDMAITFSNSNNMTLTNLLPSIDSVGKNSSNYIDFTVAGTVDTDRIYYEVYMVPKSNSTMSSTNIDNYVKVYLTDQNDVKINDIKLYKSLRDSTKNNGKVIYQAIVEPNNNGTIKNESKDFRLRVWLKEGYSSNSTEVLNFSVYLYAINVDDDFTIPLEAYDVMQNNVNTVDVINFANNSTASNDVGIYRLLGTENDDYPVYYYRGSVNNNNVVFGGYCWQMVRTTDTGGVKMIYNGAPSVSASGYNCGITRPIQELVMSSDDLTQNSGYFYADDYEIVSTSGNGATYRLKAGSNPITQVPVTSSNASTAIPTITANYPYTCMETTSDATCTVLYKVAGVLSGTRANIYASTDLSVVEFDVFSDYNNAMADVGYMNNARYELHNGNTPTNSIYGKNVEWHTNHYLVIDDTANVASINVTKDNYHHYTCGTVTSNQGDTECASVRYYYHNDNYITLTNGETIEDAIYKMTGTGSTEVQNRNSSYDMNVNDSAIKTIIDNWFRANLTDEVNTNNPNYSSYLEDTVYCNDRSLKNVVGNTSYPVFTESGWNRDGGSLTKTLHFGTMNRAYNNWYSSSNVPSVSCPNRSDSFTVSSSNGNGRLTYPVGLLTIDEMVLAGSGGNGGRNYNFYLYTGDYYWSMSPSDFYSSYAVGFYMGNNGDINSYKVSISHGIRPVISLKFGTMFDANGDGTATNPYIVKYD